MIKLILIDLLLIILSIVFGTLLTEEVLHLLYPDKIEYHFSIPRGDEIKIYNIFDERSSLQYNLKADVELDWCKINSIGIRGDAPLKNKSQIIFLGDSVVFGIGVNDKSTLPKALEEAIHESKYQVLNLGVPGYNTEQYYLFLREKLKFLNPKMIIIGCTLNDDSPSLIMKIKDNERKYYVISYPDIYHYIKIDPEIDQWLLKNSIIFRRLNLLLAKKNISISNSYLYNIDKSSQIMAFEKLKKEADALRIPIFAVIFPMFDSPWEKYKYYAQHERLKKILKKTNIPFYDMLDDLKSYDIKKIRIDDVHFSSNGTKIAGKLINRKISRLLRSKKDL